VTPHEIAARLEAFIAREAGATSVRVSGMRRLTGGASRETWSCDAALDRGGLAETLPLILQRDVRGAQKALSRRQEFALLQAVYDAGVLAPEPLWFGDDSLEGEFFLVRRIDGETLPRRLLRDDEYAATRKALPAQLGEILAKIHAVPLSAPGLDALPAPPDAASPAADELARYEQVFRGIALEPHPVFELAFRWLARNLPDGAPRSLVHGDYRIGNVLFDTHGARAMLDWELAHIGDPAEDMGFLCVRSWRFGGDKPVGGIGSREEFFAAYEAAGGATVDPARVHYWEVFGNLRWGVICLGQARVYLDGNSNSVELASIGRRTAETEWELLELVS
jgi:aminoglycoside phosphotransferase (APT) family kinase protein